MILQYFQISLILRARQIPLFLIHRMNSNCLIILNVAQLKLVLFSLISNRGKKRHSSYSSDFIIHILAIQKKIISVSISKEGNSVNIPFGSKFSIAFFDEDNVDFHIEMENATMETYITSVSRNDTCHSTVYAWC